MNKFRIASALVLAVTVIALAVGLAPERLAASSHREAPLISKDAFADNTDTWVWVNPYDPSKIVLVGSWIPFEGPEGAPKYWEWDDTATYYMYVDSDGDAVEDWTYSLTSRVEVLNPDTFLYNTSTIDTIDDTDWNRRQFITVTETDPDGVVRVLVDDELTAPSNIGDKSTPNYRALVNMARYTYVDPDNGDYIKVFGGQTDDAFFVDLQVFDLLTLRGQPPPVGYGTGGNRPVDSVSGFNNHSLVLEIPIDRLVDADPVLGVWAATNRESLSVSGDAPTASVQVSRLGMPLVNEAVLPVGLQDTFNSIPPSADLGVYALLQESVEDPEIGNLLCALYAVPLPDDADDNCVTEYTPGVPSTGRSDIFQIFVTGMVLVNPFTIETAGGPLELPAGFNVNQPVGVVPAEMIRINTAISGDTCHPTPQRLGLLAGDACGFPNGRRLIDDTTDIELLAVAGAAYQALDGTEPGFVFDPALFDVLTDRVDDNDVAFRGSFPYLADAQSGQKHFHQNQKGPFPPISLFRSSPWLGIAAVPGSLLLGLYVLLRRRKVQ